MDITNDCMTKELCLFLTLKITNVLENSLFFISKRISAEFSPACNIRSLVIICLQIPFTKL